jgi:stress response protein YsnF
MNQSLVAVFEDRTQAERARQELISSGVSSDCLTLHATDSASDSAVTTAPGTQIDTETGIGHFFRTLFGLEDDRPAVYEEAARRGHCTLVVDCQSEDDMDRIHAILDRYDVIDIDERAGQWKAGMAEGRATMDAGRTTLDSGRMEFDASQRGPADANTEARIPVIEENLQVGKREVERGRVRVYTRVMERPVEESVQLREERAQVSRQPADRPATEADLNAFKEGSMEIREKAEIPVVQKQARVVEEVQVGKQVQERTETVRDKVRKTDVQVEEEAAPTASEGERLRRKDSDRPV